MGARPPPPFGGGEGVWQVSRLTHPTFFTSQRKPLARKTMCTSRCTYLSWYDIRICVSVTIAVPMEKKQGKSPRSFLFISRASCCTTKACVPKKFGPHPTLLKRLYRARLLFQPVITDYTVLHRSRGASIVFSSAGGPCSSSNIIYTITFSMYYCAAYVCIQESECARSRLSPLLG